MKNNHVAVRLLLAHCADEKMNDEDYERLCQLSKDKHPKIRALLQASQVLNLINIEARRIIRCKYFSTYIQDSYNWYENIDLSTADELLATTKEQAVLNRYFNRLANIDLSKNDIEIQELDKRHLLIIDDVSHQGWVTFEVFAMINSKINEIRTQVAQGINPFHALPDRQAALVAIDKLIADITAIKNNFKIARLQFLSLHAIWNNTEVMDQPLYALQLVLFWQQPV